MLEDLTRKRYEEMAEGNCEPSVELKNMIRDFISLKKP